MADHSKIEWTDASWTAIRARYWEIQNDGSGKERIGWHCEHVTEGCRNCYAERLNLRLGTGREFKPGELYREEKAGYHNGEVKLFLDEEMLQAPLHWKKPRMIFVCSMTDLFADFIKDEWIDRVFAVMALCPQHTFQVLTKRPERMREYLTHSSVEDVYAIACREDESLADRWRWPLSNVWLGVSAERQQEWDERKEHLRNTPAAVRFASFEPLLGPIREPGLLDDYIDWAIVGGESGPRARPMHPIWAKNIRDQCAADGVAFFMKQWGEWARWEPGFSASNVDYLGDDNSHATNPGIGREPMVRVGKKAAGRLLDGRTHDAFPEARP
jgi:protein gp37